MSRDLTQVLLNAAHTNDIELGDDQASTLINYLTLLQKWNGTHNLTAITSTSEMLSKHLIDSLSIARNWPKGKTLDVGSGAGLPGIPLAVVNPTYSFTLVDASHKRVAFLREVCRVLQLANVTPEHARVENLTASKYDVITCRAFSSLSDFIAKTKHLIADNGRWLAMKGVYPTEELAVLDTDQYLIDVQTIPLVDESFERHLVDIRQKQ